MMILEGHIEIGDPLIEGNIQMRVGNPLTKEDTLMEDPLDEDILIGKGDPLEEEDTMMDDLPMGMENLLVMEDPLDLLVAKNYQALEDNLDQ